MEDSHEIGAVLFDLTKAFDSVPHWQLVCKLRAIGLDKYLVSWISNYLTNRVQSVVLNGETFNLLPVSSGIPQGSALGFLLFLLFIVDVNYPGMWFFCLKVQNYVEDILLYRTIYTE